jgi:L-malate glycosyltransferase
MKDKLQIGIVCYPTYGGSGVIASELGVAMAKRGHTVHFISYELPRRLQQFHENVFFYQVEVQNYPVFVHPPYCLSLASKIVDVSNHANLDIVHVHYAVPHATSAYLARQILSKPLPKVITTLHGTDITLVGSDPSYLPITKFSIMQSDGITVPSSYLKQATYDELRIPTQTQIDIIPNFVNTEVFRPKESKKRSCQLWKHLERAGCKEGQPILCHVSNFRPVKRTHDLVYILELVRKESPAHLVLIGDGPDRSSVEELARTKGLQNHISFLGKLESFSEILQDCDIFLLPSEAESFGLAALEAMSCGLPVIATNIQGIPEVVVDGQTGLLSNLSDIKQMADNIVSISRNYELYQQLSINARKRAETNFSQDKVISQFENYYAEILHPKSNVSTIV